VRAWNALARRSATALAVIATALLALAASAQAQTFIVTNTSDSGAVGDGSLRGELKAANQTAGADTVAFASGLSGTIALSNTGLTIKESVEIDGPGSGQLTVEQTTAEHRVFLIELTQPGAVTIAGLHLTGGSTSAGGANHNGGDIENDETTGATLTVANCLVSNGKAEGAGGGIDSFGRPLILHSSTVSGNEATTGGGVEAGGASFTIEDSTISGNSATIAGGLEAVVKSGGHGSIVNSTFTGNKGSFGAGGVLLAALPGTTATVADSTIADNFTFTSGGGIAIGTSAAETIAIEDSTISGNNALGAFGSAGVGGLEVEGPAQRLVDTIVAGNNLTNPGPEITGKWATSFSLLEKPAGAEVTETVPGSDLIGVDPQLGPLAENGGPTATMALAPTSPAVNKGGGMLTTDQRGDPRPLLYPGIPVSAATGANGADIGAYELQLPPPVALSPPPLAPLPAAAVAPRVRVSCPKSAKPGGCRFALQVFSAKPHKHVGKGKRGRAKPPVAESAVARVKVGAGKSALVTLKPKAKYAAKLDAAAKLLVRQVETVKGEAHTTYRRLKVLG
jgi:Right handed beta helix region